jgi:hypothetical protein
MEKEQCRPVADTGDADEYLAQCCNDLSLARELLKLAALSVICSDQLHSARTTEPQPEAADLEQQGAKILTLRRRATV